MNKSSNLQAPKRSQSYAFLVYLQLQVKEWEKIEALERQRYKDWKKKEAGSKEAVSG